MVWKDDAQIAWILRSKSWVNEDEGSTTFFVRELATDRIDYEMILSDINQHINVEGKDEETE